jgi:hypothetical protein
MDLLYIIQYLFFNKRYFSSFIKTILISCLIIYNFKKYKILKKILELLYFPITIITTYNVLFTLGELFNWPIFKGDGYFNLLYGLSSIIKIILLIILLNHKIKLKFISVILTLLLWIIFAKITKLKDYEANNLEYLLIFLISLLFCLLINKN